MKMFPPLICASLACLILACGERPASPQASNPAIAEPVDAALLAAKLEQVDALDGTIDHTVSKCASCMLRMDGKQEHALEVDDYQLHFCSKYCQTTFTEEPQTKIMALVLPQAEAVP